MKRGLRNRAQSTVEYAMIFGIVTGVIVGVQVYVQRGLKAKMADATDTVIAAGVGMPIYQGVQLSGAYRQWEPGYQHSTSQTSQQIDLTEHMSGSGAISREQTEVSTRTGSYSYTDMPESVGGGGG